VGNSLIVGAGGKSERFIPGHVAAVYSHSLTNPEAHVQQKGADTWVQL